MPNTGRLLWFQPPNQTLNYSNKIFMILMEIVGRPSAGLFAILLHKVLR